MAEKEIQQRSTAGRYTGLWMLLAILTVGGFLVWVTVNSEPSQVAVVEGAEAEESEFGAGFDVIDPEEFAADPGHYIGRQIHLSDLPIAAPLGGDAYWVTLPGEDLYLIKLTPAVRDRLSAGQGDRITVAGPVVVMTDSVIDAWTNEGVIVSDGERMAAAYAPSFIEVLQASVAADGTDGSEEVGEGQGPTE